MTGLLDTMRAYPEILQACGVMGSILYIGGFALLQMGRICGGGLYYSYNQLMAASLVMISLVGAFNLGAFLIQIGFLFFGMIGLVRRLRLLRTGRYPEGTGLIRHLPDAPTAPGLRDGLPATCDWERRQPGPEHDRPVPPALGGAAPAP